MPLTAITQLITQKAPAVTLQTIQLIDAIMHSQLHRFAPPLLIKEKNTFVFTGF